MDSLYESWRSDDEEIATSPDMGGNADISDEEFFDTLYATLSECHTDTTTKSVSCWPMRRTMRCAVEACSGTLPPVSRRA